METCDVCGTTIISGSRKEGNQTYCSERCYRSASTQQAAASAAAPTTLAGRPQATLQQAAPRTLNGAPAAPTTLAGAPLPAVPGTLAGAPLPVSQPAPQYAQQASPANYLADQVTQVHRGPCPSCGGPGPIDVHSWHIVVSAIYLTSRRTNSQLSCVPCGKKKQITGALVTLAFGWWGFPFGLIFTPIYLGMNISAMLKPPDPSTPSERLRELVRENSTQMRHRA
jgi:hypothetical protein